MPAAHTLDLLLFLVDGVVLLEQLLVETRDPFVELDVPPLTPEHFQYERVAVEIKESFLALGVSEVTRSPVAHVPLERPDLLLQLHYTV